MLEAKAGLSEERFVTYGFLCFFRNPIFSIPPFVFHIFPSPYLLFPSLVIPVERETASWTRDCCFERERDSSIRSSFNSYVRDTNVHVQVYGVFWNIQLEVASVHTLILFIQSSKRREVARNSKAALGTNANRN